MKKLILIIGFIFILFIGCSNTSDKVTITTDRTTYNPSMSSIQGIRISPNFETKKSYEDLIYHWETSDGEFIGKGKEVKNQGEAVIWSSVVNEKIAEIKDPFDIKVEVIGSESKKVLATAKLTITPNNGSYEIKK
ncbi:hypothetical protein [Clostridium fungisolvens]|uniref:Lipoprotein n=1 Tax=Clostridium fungisolvens TaxID=1604897 RepID=A0A6V8SG11_9CLOT|nr:hypothetical protein [Clostridium fungisolvens]GFP76154.1 hypothetical protein bsdtw1_02252 [Clostridium fungisolvens]